jgi:nitroreductase
MQEQNPVLDAQRQHRSVRRFLDESVPDEDVSTAVASAQCAATSSNLQAYSLYRVRRPEQRERLVELTGTQPWVRDCGAFFVVSGDARRLALAAKRAGLPREENLESFLLCVIDATLFAQNLALAFESMGYGICFIGGLRNHLTEVDALLGVPRDVYPLYGLCAGRPAETPRRRPRMAVEAVLEDGRWQDERELADRIAAYDIVLGRDYTARGKPGYDWSTGVAKKFRAPSRPELAAYYRSKGARLG